MAGSVERRYISLVELAWLSRALPVCQSARLQAPDPERGFISIQRGKEPGGCHRQVGVAKDRLCFNYDLDFGTNPFLCLSEP